MGKGKLKSAFNQLGDWLGDVAVKSEQVADKVSDKVETAVKKAVKTIGWSTLSPFMPLMKKALKNKNIAFASNASISDIAQKFYYNVVLNDSYESQLHFGHSDDVFYIDYDKVDSIDPVTISIIITAIIAFIQSLQKKKKAGEPLTKSQLEIAQMADRVDAEMDRMIDDETNYAIGEIISENYILIIGVIIAIFALTRKS